jgi:ribonuclease G
LVVHPFVFAFLTRGWFNFRWKWWRKLGQWVKIKPQNASHFLEYHFLNKNGDEIKM